MDSVSMLNSLLNMILENNLYQQNLLQHQSCDSCLSCRKDLQDLHNKNINDLPQLLSYLSKRSKASPEALAFSTKIEEKVVCICQEYTGNRNIIIQKLKVTASDNECSLSNLLKNEIKKKSGNFCANPKCDYRKSDCRLRIDSLSNLLISINWQTKSLSTLLNFLLSLDSTLDLKPIYKETSVVYLQGMVLRNSHTSVFITLQPCRIYSSIGYFKEISLDYLNYLIIQYSLYPSIIVYNESSEPSNYSEISKLHENQLNAYLKFLNGDVKVQTQICFLCWGNSHEYCNQVYCSKGWGCRCGYMNPLYSLFCLNCNFRLRDKSGIDTDECLVCLKTLESTYCDYCFFLANCWSCERKILKTQLFGCPICFSWTSSLICTTCKSDLSFSKVQCFSCFENNYSSRSLCKHNKESLSCNKCLYEFTCNVCFQLKSVHEPKNCGICLNEIIDGECLQCKKIQLPFNYICVDCVYSSKKCSKNHAITKYTKTVCRNCLNESRKYYNQENPKHEEIEVCIECDIPLNSFVIKVCTLCSAGKEKHDCINYLACEECFEYLVQCTCGARIFSRTKKCPICNKNADLQVELRKLDKQFEEQKDWKCGKCLLSNDSKTIFCENCNSRKVDLANSTFCKICNRDSDADYCKKCYKYGNCGECRKDMLLSQAHYCSFCRFKLNDRVCNNCKRVLLKSQILCYICSINKIL